MNLAQIGNLIEAIVWLVIGSILLTKSIHAAVHTRLLQILAASFIVFGLTDLIEIQSGAWWKPPWLLAIKAICVVSFALCLWQYFRTKAPAIENDSPPS